MRSEKRRVPEIHYRSSRICRVLGNPTAYQIVKLLIQNCHTPSAIAVKLKLSITTVSTILRHLRQIDLVRYENLREGKVYFVKDNKIVSVLDQIEALVKRLRSREY
ncbi:MAG: winged helix-turn-helix transcriptional regulator [candidate division WOR-3 bacterium]|nr:MAG: winged helix-turn-helix transcriptional regulator [candidate division WOR-3 bacterium]